MAKQFFTESSKEAQKSLSAEDMLEPARMLQKSFLSMFNGVAVRIDKTLQGNEWYCAVSQEIYDQLKNREAEKTNGEEKTE